MGFLVACWSPLHGRGTTSTCMALATQFSYRYNSKVAITHTHLTRSTMETAFLKGNEEEDLLSFSDMGIDSIDRALRTGTLKKDDFKAYCNKINGNLSFLSGSKKTNDELFKDSIGKNFKSICKFAKESNDITFIDIESGFTKEIAREVVELADIVIVNLDQTNQLCKEYFESKIEEFNKEEAIVAISRYDWASKYSKKYIDKTFNQNVFVIPSVTEYLDAMNNHRVDEFFRLNHHLEDELLFDELNRLNIEIVTRAEEKGIIFEEKEVISSKPKRRLKIFNR